MIGLASQRKNSATLMEMKPKRFSLGRNPLSDAPHRNPGVVSNGQGTGRHPLGGEPYPTAILFPLPPFLLHQGKRGESYSRWE